MTTPPDQPRDGHSGGEDDEQEEAREDELRREYEERQEGEATEPDDPGELPHVPPFSRS